MNILSISYSYFPEKGGVQNVIQNLSEHFVKMGHSSRVLCTTECEVPIHQFINGVEVYRIKDKYYKRLMHYSIKFPNYFLKYKIIFDSADIINVHGYHSLFSWQVITFLKKKGYSEKIVFTPHYEGIGFTFLTNFLHRLYRYPAQSSFTAAKKVICVSDYERKNLISKFNIDSRDIIVIPNGIESVPKGSVNKYFNRDNIRLLYVGRLKQKKGVQYVLDAIKYLNDSHRLEVEFNIIGSGDYTDTLKKKVDQYKLKKVNFLGKISDEKLVDIYKNSDIFLLISKSEAYGIVVAEALSYGLVTIVSNTTALTEFVKENGCFGVDYPPKSEELGELIYSLSCMDHVVVGPFDENKISSWEDAAEKYIHVYYSIISNNNHNFDR